MAPIKYTFEEAFRFNCLQVGIPEKRIESCLKYMKKRDVSSWVDLYMNGLLMETETKLKERWLGKKVSSILISMETRLEADISIELSHIMNGVARGKYLINMPDKTSHNAYCYFNCQILERIDRQEKGLVIGRKWQKTLEEGNRSDKTI